MYSNPTAMETDMLKWHWGRPPTKMSNSRLIKIRTGCQY